MLSQDEIIAIDNHFCNTIGYRFQKKELLIQALTRTSAKGSYLPASAYDFERLEFIGDRVLNLAIAEQLYELYPSLSPGELQKKYVALTRNTDDSKINGGPLYRVAKELMIEAFLIKSPIEDITKHGDRGKLPTHNRKTKEGILADHVEALMGALYLDCDKDMNVILLFVKKYWSQLGLNEDNISESSFGKSVDIEKLLPNEFKQIKQKNILLTAAKINNWQNALIALNGGADLTAADDNGLTALHHFARWNNEEAVQLLLEMNAEIDCLDHNQWTPLLHAADKGAASTFETLAQAGASIDYAIEDNDEVISALSLAAKNAHSALVKKILQDYQYLFRLELINSAYKQAQVAGKIDIQNLILKAIKQYKKNQDMFNAVANWLQEDNKHHWSQITILIMQGADARARNENNQTIFHLIAESPNRIKLINYIFDNRPILDRLELKDINPNLFEYTSSQSSNLSNIKWQDLRFKHAIFSGLNLSTILYFENVNFSFATLNKVLFNPNVKFINCNFNETNLINTIIHKNSCDEATLKTFTNRQIAAGAFSEQQQNDASLKLPVNNEIFKNNTNTFWSSRNTIIVSAALAIGLSTSIAIKYLSNEGFKP